MPQVVITAFKPQKPFDIEAFAKTIADRANVDPIRFTITLNFHDNTTYYRGRKDGAASVTLTLPEINGEEFIKELGVVVAKVTQEFLELPENAVALSMRATPKGYSYNRGEFK